ncbi:MAG: RnfH family protein [Buchnera aphidicola (Chaetogeoica yunlongensis)]
MINYKKKITIYIVYFLKKIQYIKKFKVKNGICVKDALKISKIINNKHLNITNNNIGIYGELISFDYILNNNDRIEIYQPLKINPKELRIKKIKKKKIV